MKKLSTLLLAISIEAYSEIKSKKAAVEGS